MKYLNTYQNWNKINEGRVDFNLKSCGREDWDKEIVNNDDFYKEVIYMTPLDFLKKAGDDRFTIDNNKIDEFSSTIVSSKQIPTPILVFNNKFAYDKNLNASFHDGHHRVKALQRLNIEKIPVIISYQKDTNSAKENPIKKIIRKRE